MTANPSPVPDRARRLAERALLLAFGLVFAAAEVKFIGTRSISESRFARTTDDPPGCFDLADARLGVTVRADSTYWALRHHPAYVLGRHAGTLTEKWVSAPGDRAPWIEVELDGPRRVDQVRLALAGVLEGEELTMRDFTVECFAGARVLASAAVVENRDARPRVPLHCDGATRVRVRFVVDPESPRDVVRLYSVEIWGSA